MAEERSWQVAIARHKARDLLATTIVCVYLGLPLFFFLFFSLLLDYVSWADKMRKSTREKEKTKTLTDISGRPRIFLLIIFQLWSCAPLVVLVYCMR